MQTVLSTSNVKREIYRGFIINIFCVTRTPGVLMETEFVAYVGSERIYDEFESVDDAMKQARQLVNTAHKAIQE